MNEATLHRVKEINIYKSVDAIVIEKLYLIDIYKFFETGTRIYCGCCGSIIGTNKYYMEFPFTNLMFLESLKGDGNNVLFIQRSNALQHIKCGHVMFFGKRSWDFISLEEFIKFQAKYYNKQDDSLIKK